MDVKRLRFAHTQPPASARANPAERFKVARVGYTMLRLPPCKLSGHAAEKLGAGLAADAGGGPRGLYALGRAAAAAPTCLETQM